VAQRNFGNGRAVAQFGQNLKRAAVGNAERGFRDRPENLSSPVRRHVPRKIGFLWDELAKRVVLFRASDEDKRMRAK
jgi:hypothetical protein